MTPEQLSIPRVICKGTKGHRLHSGSPFKHGDILTKETVGYRLNGCSVHEEELSEYPHLFRQLHWSEFREESDLPNYLSINGAVIEVNYVGENSGGVALFESTDKAVRLLGTECTPATEAEYIEYLKQKSLVFNRTHK